MRKNNWWLFFFYIFFVGIPITLAIVFPVLECFYPNNALLSRDNEIGSLMTIDGLITTSTFAFIAFISISPTSSPSTYVLNKASWSYMLKKECELDGDKSKECKGKKYLSSLGRMLFKIKMMHYLYATLILTIVNIIAMFFSQWVVVVSVILSGLLLLGLIYRYVSFNSIPTKIAGVIISDRLKYSSHDDVLFRKQLRNYILPLRSTSNTDLLSSLIKTPFAKAGFRSFYASNEKTEDDFMGTSELPTDVKRENHRLFCDRLVELIIFNNNIHEQYKNKLIALLIYINKTDSNGNGADTISSIPKDELESLSIILVGAENYSKTDLKIDINIISAELGIFAKNKGKWN